MPNARRRALTDLEVVESWLNDGHAASIRREGIQIQTVEVIESDPPWINFDGYLYLGGAIWGVGGRVSRRKADGAIVIPSIQLEARRPRDAAITARLIGKLPAGLIAKTVLAKLKEENLLNAWAEALGIPALPPARERARMRRAARSLRDGAPPRGRQGTPRTFFDVLAEDAVTFAARGLPVIASLAESRGRPERTVKAWVSKARNDEIGALVKRRGVWELGPKYRSEES